MSINYKKFLQKTDSVSTKKTNIDYNKFLPKTESPKTEPVNTNLDTQFRERQQADLNKSLGKFGIAPQKLGGMTPMKKITAFGGEARAESYYGDETITPRVSIDYEGISGRDNIKRFDILGTLRAEIDHIMPKGLGGTDADVNLKTEKANRNILDIIKKTDSQHLEAYKRQAGRLPAELKIIEKYKNGELSQVQALEMMGELKKTDMPTAFQLATQKMKGQAKSVWNYLKESSKASIQQFEDEQGIKATPLSILYGIDIQEVDGKPQQVKTKPDYKLPVQQMAENIVTAPLRIGASVHEGITGKETSFKIPKLEEIMTYQKQYNEQVEAGMPKELSGLATGVNALFDSLITYSMIRPLLNRPGKSVIEYDEAVAKGSKMTKDGAREILGINKNATVREIKSARNRLVQKYHPDKTINWNISQGEKDVLRKNFDNVMEAYSKLTKVKPQPVVINTATAEAMKKDIMKQSAGLTPKPQGIKIPTKGVIEPAIIGQAVKPTIKVSGVKPIEPVIEAKPEPKTADTEVLDKKMTLTQEAKKYKSVDEFVKNISNESNIGLSGKFETIPVNKIQGTDYIELDEALRSRKKLTFEDIDGFLPDNEIDMLKKEPVIMPIEVRANTDGTYNLMAGNHRVAQKILNGEPTIFANISNRQGKTKSQLEQIYKEAHEVKKPIKKVEETSEFETLPKDVGIDVESKRVGAKRISPDRISHQQLTPEASLDKMKIEIEKDFKVIDTWFSTHARLTSASNSWFKSYNRIKAKGQATLSDREKIWLARADKHYEIVNAVRNVKKAINKEDYEKLLNKDNLKEIKDKYLSKENIKKDYIVKVRKDISKGYKFTDEVLDFDKSFKTAIDSRARYEKGLATSFSADDSRIVFDYKDEIGAGMKRQDGKDLTQIQKDEIRNGVLEFQETLGINMKKMAENERWVYVHLNDKNPFLMKNTAGLYRKDKDSISISVGGTESIRRKVDGEMKTVKINTVISHELGHTLDYRVDNKLMLSKEIMARRYDYNPVTDFGFGTFKRGYWSKPTEVVARMIEQYVGVNRGQKHYFQREGYWKKEIYDKEIVPAVEKAIKDNFKEYRIQRVQTELPTKKTEEPITEFKNKEVKEALDELKEITKPQARAGFISLKPVKSVIDALKSVEKGATEYETLKDAWIGQKDILQLKGDVEKRKLQQTIKSVLGKKKYDTTVKNYDKAIQIYMDLKRSPGDLKKYYSKLTPEQKEIVNLARKLPVELKQVANYISESYKILGNKALKADVIKNVLENYAGRVWDLDSKQSMEKFRRFGTTTRHAKKRKLTTILQGWSKGLELKVEGATNNLSVLKQEINKTIADKQFIKELGKLRDIDGNKLLTTKKLDGYTEVEHPNFKVWRPSAVDADEAQVFGARNYFITEDGVVMEKKSLYAPKDIAKNINNMLGVSFLNKIPGVKTITKYNAVMKAWILQSSLFHHFAFARSYLLGTHGKSLKETNLRIAYKDGIKMIEDMTPTIQLGVKNGLTLGVKQDWSEELLKQKTFIENILDNSKITKVIKDKVLKLRQQQADFLFGELGAGLKAKAFEIEFRNLTKKYPNEDVNKLAKMAANLINDDFGGLHLQRMGRNPSLQHVFRIFALAPDWTESNVRSMIKVFKAGGKKEQRMYRKFWAGIFAKGAMLTLISNLFMAGLDEDDERTKGIWERFTRNYKTAWEQGRLMWTGVDITPIYRLFGGKKKERKYFSILGHFIDPLKFMIHPIRSAQHKGSVVFGLFYDALRGVDYAQRPYTTFKELLGIDKEKGEYKTTREGMYEKGDPKWGKLKGKTVAYKFGGGGTLSYEQIPSYLLNKLKGIQPVQIQNLISWMAGELEGFDALFNSAGLGLKSTYGLTEEAEKEK